MFIRSQNKEKLAPLKKIEIQRYKNTRTRQYTGDCLIFMENAGNIGDYSSEEKAMKVLDMIEKEYTNCLLTEHGQVTTPKVFHMPKDDEVEV